MNLRIVPEIWRDWRVGGYSCIVSEDVPEMLKEIALLATAGTPSAATVSRFLEGSGAHGYLEKPEYDSAALAEKARQRME